MDIKEMRAEVMKINTSKAWKTSVKNATDDEVLAIYLDQQIKKTEAAERDKELLGLRQRPFVEAFDEIINPPIVVVYPDPTGCLTLRIPHSDVLFDDNSVCRKEVLLVGWKNLIGLTIIFEGFHRKVERVNLIADLIFISLGTRKLSQKNPIL